MSPTRRPTQLLKCFPNSWFGQVRNLLLQYSLPHPLLLLENPLPKNKFKQLVKTKVTDFWIRKLREEASLLPSLDYFHPEFLSLSRPHMLLISAGNKTYEVAKARVQLLFLANQYPSNASTRHWSPANPHGLCTFSPCLDLKVKETREHILLGCPAYHTIRGQLFLMLLSTKSPAAHQVITRILFSYSTRKLMQLLLDCSVLPEVIKAAQIHGVHVYYDLFYLSRSWCFSLHRARLKRLGKWNFH